jgi:hypothetical protein
MLESLVDNNARYLDFGCGIFQTQVPLQPVGNPQRSGHCRSANLAKALKTTIPVDLRDSSIKALTGLSTLFSKAALRYNNDPATHVITPETVLTHPQQTPTTSPRVPPTPMQTSPPRVQPTVHSPRVPTSLPTSPPSAQPKTLFPAIAGYEEKRQAILPYKPTSTPPKKLRRSQQIANLSILEATPAPKDGPSYNTCSKAQIRTITQETILACINTYSNITGNVITPHSMACQQLPTDMLQAVLDKSTGQLMEMRHLLINPKYKELWGKSYTKELARLAQAQGIPGISKGTNTSRQQQRPQKTKIDGHEIPLASQQNFLQTIPTPLGPWQRKQWQLCDQTSCFHPSPSHTPDFSHTINCSTNTTTLALKPTSCSKGVLDIQ